MQADPTYLRHEVRAARAAFRAANLAFVVTRAGVLAGKIGGLHISPAASASLLADVDHHRRTIMQPYADNYHRLKAELFAARRREAFRVVAAVAAQQKREAVAHNG